MNRREALEELAERKLARAHTSAQVAKLRSELFFQQLDVWDDPSKRVSALCTRRAGKTNIWTRMMTAKALQNPKSLQRIWANSRLRCKALLWREFRWLLARQEIEATFNDTELTITFENEAVIQLVGADKDTEAQKKRGDKTLTEVVMEAQGFGSYLESIVQDVIEPSLLDLDGTLYLEGTPGAVCAGFWFKVSGGNDNDSRWKKLLGAETEATKKFTWSMHRWSLKDNPFIPNAWQDALALKAARGWGDEHPTWKREYRARWVNDYSALFYAVSQKNYYNPDEVQPWGPGWEHVLGWDLGFKDDMALVAWGWHPTLPGLYEAFSWKKPGALAQEVMDQVTALEKRLNIIEMVADTGGGGRMYVEEVMSRFEKHFRAAEKTHKHDHVRLLNGELRASNLFLCLGSPLAEEMASLPRDPDWPPPDSPEKPPREHPGFPNHCSDAALYAFRAAQHYLFEAPVRVLAKGSPEWEDAEIERIEASVNAEKDPFSQYDAEDSDDDYGIG